MIHQKRLIEIYASKRWISETYINWKARRINDMSDQESVLDAFHDSRCLILKLHSMWCGVKSMASAMIPPLRVSLDGSGDNDGVVKIPSEPLSRLILLSAIGLSALFALKTVEKTRKKTKKRSAPTGSPQNKRLKPNANACDNNNITDNNSILCHQQSNAAGSERLPLITDVDFGLSDKDSIATTIPTPSSSFRYVGLRNISKTCYINVLLQWLLHLVPFRNCLLESPLGVDNETFFENMNNSGLMIPAHIGHVQVTLFDLAQGFRALQSVCREMLSTRTPVVDPQSFIDGIGFLHNRSDCCHDVWTTLFHFYFDFLKLSGRYRGSEVLRMGQQPQPFSYLQVYLGSIGLDTNNLSLLQLLSEEYTASPPRLVHLPEVLVILLHRTRNNNGKVEKDCRSVEFPFELDMGNWCNASDESAKYIVRGVIFHDGKELHSGHYRAAIKNFDNNKWLIMNDHQVQIFDLSVPQENAAFTNQTSQPHMLLYISSMSMDVYKEDDKRFRSYFDEEQNMLEGPSIGGNSIPTSNSYLRVQRHHLLNNLNEVDSLNGALAPNLNSSNEHPEVVHNSMSVANGNEHIYPMSNEDCSSVEKVRRYSSDSSSGSNRIEEYMSCPEQEGRSRHHETTLTTVDSRINILDDFEAEYDFNVSDRGFENAESLLMSTPEKTSIFDDASPFDDYWESVEVSPIKAHNSVVLREISDPITPSSVMNNNFGRTTSLGSPHFPSKGVRSECYPTQMLNTDLITPSKRVMNNNPGRTTSLGSPHLPSKGVGSECCLTRMPNASPSTSILKNRMPQKIADLPSLTNRVVSVKHPKGQKNNSKMSHDEKWDLHFEALKQYKESGGTCSVSKRCNWTGMGLGRWVCEQRIAHKRGKLVQERFQRLEKMGFHWNGTEHYHAKLEQNFKGFFQELVKYKEVHGNVCVPRNYPENPKLGRWVESQRARCKPSTERYKLLEALGFWS